MYQHLNDDGTPYIFSRGIDHYMPVSSIQSLPSEPVLITDSNETAACLDFSANPSVTFLVVQPSTIIPLDIIPGLPVMIGRQNRMAN
jgi:hypothetical protein